METDFIIQIKNQLSQHQRNLEKVQVQQAALKSSYDEKKKEIDDLRKQYATTYDPSLLDVISKAQQELDKLQSNLNTINYGLKHDSFKAKASDIAKQLDERVDEYKLNELKAAISEDLKKIDEHIQAYDAAASKLERYVYDMTSLMEHVDRDNLNEFYTWMNNNKDVLTCKDQYEGFKGVDFSVLDGRVITKNGFELALMRIQKEGAKSYE